MYSKFKRKLQANISCISSKYLYDTLGSKLFEVICVLPTYYLTRIETNILNCYANEIKEIIGTEITLIDLGAGNCTKAINLISLFKPKQYIPIDISSEFLKDAVDNLRIIFPTMPIHPIVTDLSSKLTLPSFVNQSKRLFLYLGSSFGNFTPQDRLQFLCSIHSQCVELQDGSGILLGIDLVKKKEIIDAAYNDVLGVTAAFSNNILLHVNHLFSTNFDVSNWKYRGCFNSITQCVAMYLEAKHEVIVKTHEEEIRHFQKGERIYTENSYKFTPENIKMLLYDAGFTVCNIWLNSSEWFMICYARPR